MKLVLRKARTNTKPEQSGEDKLEHFRKLILAHLKTLDNGDAMKKAMSFILGTILEKAKALPVGTIRDWDGKKYIKTDAGKWIPKHDTGGGTKKYSEDSKGARIAVAAIRRKIDAAKTGKEMLAIVAAHKERFSDSAGNPLPFVQELSDYAHGKKTEFHGNAIKEGKSKAKSEREKIQQKAGRRHASKNNDQSEIIEREYAVELASIRNM
jgi:hypothetical protein